MALHFLFNNVTCRCSLGVTKNSHINTNEITQIQWWISADIEEKGVRGGEDTKEKKNVLQ